MQKQIEMPIDESFSSKWTNLHFVRYLQAFNFYGVKTPLFYGTKIRDILLFIFMQFSKMYAFLSKGCETN